MLTVMATKDSEPSVQSRSTTTLTGEESATPVSQPSSLGELSTSMVTETVRRLEVIQKAQVGSLMGADKTKEPQEKTPKKQSPTLAAQPKKYALEMWVEIKTSAGVYSTPEEDSYSIDFAIDAINHAYPGCTGITWMWPAICWPSMERRLTLGQVSSTIKVSWPVRLSLTFRPGWGTSLGGECDVYVSPKLVRSWQDARG